MILVFTLSFHFLILGDKDYNNICWNTLNMIVIMTQRVCISGMRKEQEGYRRVSLWKMMGLIIIQYKCAIHLEFSSFSQKKSDNCFSISFSEKLKCKMTAGWVDEKIIQCTVCKIMLPFKVRNIHIIYVFWNYLPSSVSKRNYLF